MVDRLHNLLQHHARRGVALLTAILVLAGTIGIPHPRNVAKDTSQPFPCMHHACGCTTAEACWRGCCCLSDKQKLAWARQQHVTPPKDFGPQQSVAVNGGCCTSSRCNEPPEKPECPPSDWQVVRMDAARQCQGLGSLWLILGQALPPPEADAFETDLSVVSWLAPASVAQVDSPDFQPATPPPEAAL